MSKLLAAIIAIAVMASPAMAENQKHHRRPPPPGGHGQPYHGGGEKHHGGEGHNYWHGGHNNYWHGDHNNNNYYYQDPYFWGGVAAGVIGGAIVTDQYRDVERCREVVTQVYVAGIGYRQGTAVVCD